VYARCPGLASDFWVALKHCDIPWLKIAAGRFVLLVGKAIAFCIVQDLLERAVSSPRVFFSFSNFVG
jgi:hypothetical protein